MTDPLRDRIYEATSSEAQFFESFADLELSSAIHMLAEDSDEQLLVQLIALYASREVEVRISALELLGFHCNLSGVPGIMESIVATIRDSRLNDHSGIFLRTLACGILDVQLKEVDDKLVDLLDTVSNREVRLALLRSLLQIEIFFRDRVERLTELLAENYIDINSSTYRLLLAED